MKCKVPQKNLVSALKIIKTSKALGKIDSDEEVCLKIFFNKEENEIEFIASNVGVWVSSSIGISDFSSCDEPDEMFGVEEGGEIFLEAREFISLVETFPAKTILQMLIEEKGELNHFTVSILKSEKKGKKKNVSFLTVIKPKFFEEVPPEEKRKTQIVSTEALLEAVSGVEFAAELDPIRQHLWGVQIEIYGEKDVSACATDTLRICWFDQIGIDRDTSPAVVTPIKSSLVSAVKSLDPKESVNIHIGEKYTVLDQKNQWHGIPNAIQIGEDKMPEWRGIVREMQSRCRDFVDVPRQPLADCLKSATLTSGGRYGIRLMFNSKEKNITFTVENVEDNYSVRSYMTETEPLDDDCFGSDIRCAVSFRVEHLKEIINKYKSDHIRFMLQGDNQTVLIIDKNEPFQYVSTVIRNIA